jgi:hypothetical protein
MKDAKLLNNSKMQFNMWVEYKMAAATLHTVSLDSTLTIVCGNTLIELYIPLGLGLGAYPDNHKEAGTVHCAMQQNGSWKHDKYWPIPKLQRTGLLGI